MVCPFRLFLFNPYSLEWVLEGEKGPNFGKNAKFVEFGNQGGAQGKRTDLQEFYAHVRDGKTDLELAEINFSCFARCLKAIDRLRLALKPKRTVRRDIVAYVGDTGAGKTRLACESYPDLYEIPTGKDIWFDAYYLDTTALFDEFTGQMPLNQALRVIAEYNVVKVPIKGGFTWFNPDNIIITSNSHPNEWYDYKNRREQERALRRRFSAIHHFTNGKVIIYEGESINNFWPIVGDKIDLVPIQMPLIFTPEKPLIDAVTHWTRCSQCLHLRCDCTCI